MSDFVLDVGGINQRINSFDKRHGRSVFYRNWYWYEDGARRSSDPMGLLAEPSENPTERAQAIELYFRVLKDRAIKAFDDMKQQLASMAQAHQQMGFSGGHVPSPPGAFELHELEKLKSAAVTAKIRWDAAVKAVEKATPPHVLAMQKSNAENIQKNADFIQRLNRIEV